LRVRSFSSSAFVVHRQVVSIPTRFARSERSRAGPGWVRRTRTDEPHAKSPASTITIVSGVLIARY
jgi:hypothetical protein